MAALLAFQAAYTYRAGDTRNANILVGGSAVLALAAVLVWYWRPNVSRQRNAGIALVLAAYSGMHIYQSDALMPWAIVPIACVAFAVYDFLGYTSRSGSVSTGDIFTIFDQGQYRTAKVIADADGMLMIRLYSGTSPERPKNLDLGLLELDEASRQPVIVEMSSDDLDWYEPEVVIREQFTPADAAAVSWYASQSAA